MMFLHFGVGWGCEKEKEVSSELLTLGGTYGARKTEKKGNGKKHSLEATRVNARRYLSFPFSESVLCHTGSLDLTSKSPCLWLLRLFFSLSPSYCFALTPVPCP